MAGYRQTNPDRAKAALAAVIVHAAIGAAFLTGLVVNVSKRPSDVLQTFDITLPPPPPPVVDQKLSPAKGDPGEAGKKANPTPVVAPKPTIVVPAKSPVVAAPVAGTGSAATAGAALVGNGTGAGGNGNGLGGGGNGGGFTPAQKVTKIPDREYRRIRSMSGMTYGSVGVSIRVGTDGVPSNCRIARTSGNAAVDSLMCQLTVAWVRFRPARDPQGRAVAQDVTWYPNWSPR
jgi:protein TonB